MSNVLSDSKKQQVIALGRLGWSLRRIERETGVRRETVGRYLSETGVPRRPPRGRVLPAKAASQTSTDLSKAASQTITDSAVSAESVPQRTKSASACEPYREFIEDSLLRGRNNMAIWQDLVGMYGFAAAYSSVNRYVTKLHGGVAKEACCIIATAPGQEAQVDYGEGPMVRDATGKYRRTRLFIMTLGYSRKAVRLLTWRSSSRIWAELHEKAFRRLGGVTNVVVLDNLREGVIKPDIYDPALNVLYSDVLKHYGTVALPCRVRHPDRKGKVESSIGHTQRTPLKGMRFDTIEEAQAYLDNWDATWADTRIHGTTKRQVSAMFAEEKPTLRQLPVTPFRYYEFGERKVHLDGCVEVGGAYYGAPPGMIGRRVHVQWDSLSVRILSGDTRLLLREHARQRPGHYRVRPEDKPARTPQPVVALLSRARTAGVHIGSLCEAIHQREGELGVRRIMGVLNLAKKHGSAAVDDACAAACEMHATSYQFVRRYIERRPSPQLTLKQVDPLIRELTHYRDLINNIT